MLKKRIQTLIDLINNTEIEEIEVSSFWGAQKIKLSKSKLNQNHDKKEKNDSIPSVNVEAPIQDDLKPEPVKTINQPLESENTETLNEEKVEDEIKEDINCYNQKAPLVGTFYSSPKPSDPPFVNVGDKVSKGQVVCIIEAMKIFNDIEAEVNGTVHEICADNGSPVEYDQVIIKILPE